jgi:hypothetical protein
MASRLIFQAGEPMRLQFKSPSRLTRVGLAVALCLPTCICFGADRGPLDQDFQLSIGGFFVSTDTELRLDGHGGRTGSDVDWEHDLNFEDKDRFRVDAFWRFAENHKLRFMYFENNRASSRQLSRQVNFGDYTFPLNAQVDAELNTQIIELAYEYAFLKRDTVELSGSFGIHNINIAAALSGNATAGNSTVSAQVDEKGSLNGPLPVLGLHVLWKMGGQFYLDGLAQFFYVEANKINGRISDYKLGVTWYPLDHVGFGLGYNEFITTVNVDKDSFNGRLRMSYGGALAYLTAGF